MDKEKLEEKLAELDERAQKQMDKADSADAQNETAHYERLSELNIDRMNELAEEHDL